MISQVTKRVKRVKKLWRVPPLWKHGRQMMLRKMTLVVLLVGWQAARIMVEAVRGICHHLLLCVEQQMAYV